MKLLTRILLACCVVALLTSALAADYMTARLDGNTLRVRWPAVSGDCTLSIYSDGWPLLVTTVDGNKGGATLALGEACGRISVRLKTPVGVMAADAEGGKDGPDKGAATQKTTKAPEITAKPKATPSSTKAQKPTAKPTSNPSPKKTQTPTAKPQATQGPISGSTKPSLAAQVIAEVNAERAKQGLGQVRESAELNRAAAVRARELAQVFSHSRPDGSSWSTVSGSALAENIAMGQKTADKVMAAWMSSDGHRANILRAGYGSIGVCAYISNGVTYWVQLFGR